MNKLIGWMLSICMLAGMAGCAAPSGTAPVELTRAETATVYGTQAPAQGDEKLFEGEMVQTQMASAKTNGTKLSASAQEELRGVWLAYVNYRDVIEGNTKAQFTSNMDAQFEKIAGAGFNTVFMQVRPFGDALYESSYFPWSRYLTGTEGKDPGYDPLTILCQLADKHGLRIEAWINPYRVRTDSRTLAANNQAAKWVQAGNPAALKWGDGIYYNPGNAEARKLIVNGVAEIVKKYDVDGIHFDDYFYPTTDMKFDAATYKASGSKLSQADWRRENVNILVRDVYKTIKSIDPDCVFGISPQGNMDNNYNGQFIDCAKWLANPGYVDYILPQIYFGYKNEGCPYAETVAAWSKLIKQEGIQLYVGLGAYKVGGPDTWAGAGQNEWIGTTDLLARMTKTARQAAHYGGVVIYNYDSLFSTPGAQMKAERENLIKLFN